MRFLMAIRLLSCVAQADDFSTEGVSVYWPVVESDDVGLAIRKTSKGTIVRLAHRFPCYVPCEVSLTPEQAVKVGRVLKKTDEAHRRLDGASNKQEVQPIGKDVSIRFQTDRSKTFRVVFLDEHGVERVSLNREDANDLAPYFEKMVERAKFLDSKVSL